MARGVGRFAWAFYEYDRVMRAPDPAAVAVAFPPAGSEDFAVSGFERGAEQELGGTAAVLDERVGSGRSVVFSFEPNFRAFTDGTQRMLRNAVLGPAGPASAGTAAERSRAALRRARSRIAAPGADDRGAGRPGAAAAVLEGPASGTSDRSAARSVHSPWPTTGVDRRSAWLDGWCAAAGAGVTHWPSVRPAAVSDLPQPGCGPGETLGPLILDDSRKGTRLRTCQRRRTRAMLRGLLAVTRLGYGAAAVSGHPHADTDSFGVS